MLPNPPSEARSFTSRLLRAWLCTAVVDGLWAVVLTLAYGRSVTRLWQGVAATAFGERVLSLGTGGVLLGLVVHACVALGWSLVLVMLVTRWRWLGDVLASPFGVLKVGVVFGPLIWIVMSAIVIPLATHKPLVLTGRWWIQLAGHALFVGVPMAWGASAGAGSRNTSRQSEL